MTFSRSLGERLDFGNGAELVEAGFNYCIDLFVKFKGRIEYHTKVFDLGLDQSRQIA